MSTSKQQRSPPFDEHLGCEDAPAPMLLEAVTVRRAGVPDAEALLRLHREGFGSGWGMRHWRWRFVDNPLRRTEIIGAFTTDGRCVASFCGVPLPCRYDNEPALVQRAGDVTVHPRLRSSMAGSTLLLKTSDLFFRTFGGGPTRVVFGFPQLGLSRTIVRHCRVEVLGDVLLLARDTGAGKPDCDVVTTTGAEVPVDVDRLAARWQLEVTTGIVRDRRYLRWRYEANPHASYVFAAARDASGELRGLAVLRTGGLDREALVLVEWIVPRGDEAAARTLLATAASVARACGRTSLVVGFASSSPEFARFQREHGFHVLRSPYQFVFRSYATGIDRSFLAERWFHSLGDLDFA